MADIKAKVKNLRESGNYFSSGYRPAFKINKDYLSTGEIELIGRKKLDAGESCEAYISFLTPEIYPESMWKGKRLIFLEGEKITGVAIVEEVYNQILILK